MVRFMAMHKPQEMNAVRLYYYSWFTAFYALTIVAGLATRIYLPTGSFGDAELALPTLANELLPEILIGLMLAGLFAATISTADSQVISCSAAFTRDLLGEAHKDSYWVAKLATVGITAITLGIALYGNQSVFQLVLIAWSALASAFAPLLMVLAWGKRPSELLSISMMLFGLAAMLAWRQAGLADLLYEVVPGMMGGLLFYWIWQLIAGVTTAGGTTAKDMATKSTTAGGRDAPH